MIVVYVKLQERLVATWKGEKSFGASTGNIESRAGFFECLDIKLCQDPVGRNVSACSRLEKCRRNGLIAGILAELKCFLTSLTIVPCLIGIVPDSQ